MILINKRMGLPISNMTSLTRRERRKPCTFPIRRELRYVFQLKVNVLSTLGRFLDFMF